jgi:hypothetical protein
MMKLSSMLVRRSGLAAMMGGVLWLLIWALFLVTHGLGPVDEKGTLLGVTYYDFTKFLVVPLGLYAVGLMGLHARQRAGAGRLAAVGLGVAVVALGVIAVGLAVALWPLPWGSYAQVDWEATPMMWGGILYSLGTFALAIGQALFGVGVWQARVWPAWVSLLLVLSPLASVPWLHMTTYGGLYGLAWLALGGQLWAWQGRPSRSAGDAPRWTLAR